MLTFYDRENDVIVSLDIRDYESQNIVEDYDANWLFLFVKATTPALQWQSSSPCILTWEIIQLKLLLEQIRNSKAGPFSTFTNLKLDLSFEYLGYTEPLHHLKLVLEHSLRPRENTRSFQTVIHATNNELDSWITELNTIAAAYPPRGELGRQWVELLRANQG